MGKVILIVDILIVNWLSEMKILNSSNHVSTLDYLIDVRYETMV